MSAIVPFVAQELAKPANAAMAFDLFLEAGKAAGGLFKAHKAKRGRNSAKATYRTKKTKHGAGTADLGHDATVQENRRNGRQQGITAQLNKTMYNTAIIQIEKNVAGDEAINKRSRDVITHKGSKLCFTVKNTRDVPIYFNWAVVIPKAQTVVDNTNFLRGNGVERDVALNNTLSSLEMKCLPVNTDLYTVVKRKSMVIYPDSDKATGAGNESKGRDLRVWETYIKTHRKLYFNGDTAVPLQNMYMVWWCDYYGSPTGASSNTCQVEWKIVDYFHDVK